MVTSTEQLSMRNAILAAADHIEKKPRSYDFGSVDIPATPECGTSGCALGWIHTFSHIQGIGKARDTIDAGVLFGISDSEFYNRMSGFSEDWRSSSKEAAYALRQYADRYFREATNG